MPTYDYQCQACGERFEKFQSINARPLRKCPSCGRMKLRRLIGSGAAVIFRGSGFYHTDYRSKSGAKQQESPADKGDQGGDKSDNAPKGEKKKEND